MNEPIFTRFVGDSFPCTCKHYRAISSHSICEAGVVYQDVFVEQAFKYRSHGIGAVYTQGKSMPCWKDSDPLGVCHCPHQSFPTAEEVAADEEENNILVLKLQVARAAIAIHAGKKRGVQAKIPCPVCEQGTLEYSIAHRNGHVHARCDTPDCVAWME